MCKKGTLSPFVSTVFDGRFRKAMMSRDVASVVMNKTRAVMTFGEGAKAQRARRRSSSTN